MIKPWLVLALVCAAACSSSHDVVTDADRGLEDQSLKGVSMIAEKIKPVTDASQQLATLKANATSAPEAVTAAGQALGAATSDLGAVVISVIPAIKANLVQLQKVHGPPASPQPFNPAAAPLLAQQSDQEHKWPGWLYLLFGAGGIATLSVAAGKVSQYVPLMAAALSWIPGLGPWVTMAQAVIQGVASVRATIPTTGTSPVPPLTESNLLDPIAKVADQLGVSDLLERTAHAIEQKVFGKQL